VQTDETPTDGSKLIWRDLRRHTLYSDATTSYASYACTTPNNALDFATYLPKIRLISVVLFHAKRRLFPFSH